MSSLLAGLILFLTVSTSLVVGILAAYGAVAGIIFLFAHQSGRANHTVPATLVPSQSHASGD